MTTKTEAERLADYLESIDEKYAAAELRRLVSFNQQLMDEVARLNRAVTDEREACAKFFEDNDTNLFWGSQAATHIRARGNK